MNFLDPDQTHDRLFAQKIKPEILSLLTNAISAKGIFDTTMPIALIEREAPGVLNPWAEDWSGKMFEFLKKLSLTHILDDGYLNGSAYGFEPQYTANLPELIDLEEYHADKLTVRIPSGSVGILTWLERTHNEQSAPYCDKLSNKLTIAMRRSRLFKNPAPESLEIELITRNWLHNSVCFQGVELVGLTANQADFLLYQNMENFLDYLWGFLDISPCKVLKSMTAKYRTEFIFDRRQWVWNAAGSDWKTTTNFLTLENPLFAAVPESYYYAYLQKGESEIGKPVTAISNGYNLNLEIAYNWDFFENWQQIEGRTTPSGFTRDTDGALQRELSVSLPYNPTFIDFQLSTCNFPIIAQNEFTGIAAYPPFTVNQNAATVKPYPVNNFSQNSYRFFPFLDFFEDGFVSTRTSLFGFPINKPEYNVLTGSTNPPGVTVSENIGRGSVVFNFNPQFYGITFFCGDPNLFKNSSAAIFWHDIARKSSVIWSNVLSDGFWHQIGRTLEDRTTELSLKIEATYKDYLLQEPDFTLSIVESNSETLFSESITWYAADAESWESIEYIQLPPDPITIEVESSIILNKSFV